MTEVAIVNWPNWFYDTNYQNLIEVFIALLIISLMLKIYELVKANQRDRRERKNNELR